LQQSINTNRRSITPVLGRQNKKLESVVLQDKDHMFECELPFPAHQVPIHSTAHLTTRPSTQLSKSHQPESDTFTVHAGSQKLNNENIYNVNVWVVDAWKRACDRHNRTIVNWGLDDDEYDQDYLDLNAKRARELLLGVVRKKAEEEGIEPIQLDSFDPPQE
jgi:hypothetical protein